MTREEKIELLEKEKAYMLSHGGDKQAIALDSAIKALEQEPCENIGRWIPVSERLPEDSELVLFSTKTDRVFEGKYFADNPDRQWYSFRDDTFAWNNVVTAWMPLPHPYKEESGGKE